MKTRDELIEMAVAAMNRAVDVQPRRRREERPVIAQSTEPASPISAREWVRVFEQRQFDLAYTALAAREIALRRLLAR